MPYNQDTPLPLFFEPEKTIISSVAFLEKVVDGEPVYTVNACQCVNTALAPLYCTGDLFVVAILFIASTISSGLLESGVIPLSIQAL